MPEPVRYTLPGGASLGIERGDLTRARVDAIVNAANQTLLGGGGVDGAIHRAAGPELLRACEALAEVRPGVRCPTGEARLTPGFGLPARYVIHTVGPRYRSDQVSAPLLRGAYASSLAVAREHADIRTIAFPAISCGVYGYPLRQAAEIALAVIRDGAGDLSEVRFVLFTELAMHHWQRALRRLFAGS